MTNLVKFGMEYGEPLYIDIDRVIMVGDWILCPQGCSVTLEGWDRNPLELDCYTAERFVEIVKQHSETSSSDTERKAETETSSIHDRVFGSRR